MTSEHCRLQCSHHEHSGTVKQFGFLLLLEPFKTVNTLKLQAQLAIAFCGIIDT